MGIHLNYIETGRQKLFYRISGEQNPRTIIFVHGLAGDSRFFHNQMKYFGERYRIIAIDLPGHGRSHRADDPSAELYSRSIELVAEKENLARYILAGHSMGGAVCLEHYMNNRGRIESLILISTSHRIPVTDEMISRSVNEFETFFDALLSATYYKKAGIFILAAKRLMGEEEAATITADLRICRDMDYTGVLEQISIPVLVIANRHDKMIPAEQTIEMQKRIRNSKLVIFENHGHIPFFEESEQFNSAVMEFISSIQ